jgi:predicted permease
LNPLIDLRYAIRTLIKTPAFTLVVVATIALGISANSAVFSVANAVLLRPLPYPDPDQLVVLNELGPRGGSISISYPSFLDWRRQAKSFERMAGFRGNSFTVSGVDSPGRITGLMTSAGFFEILGVKALRGRLFVAEDDKPASKPVALLSYSAWQTRFGGDSLIVGRTLLLNDDPVTVVGVLPHDFSFGTNTAGVFMPLSAMTRNRSVLDRGNHQGIRALARMRPGIRIEQARAEIKTIARQLEQQYPNSNSGVSASAVSLLDLWAGNLRTTLNLMLAAVGFVLLIACANAANLLLTRASGRQRETSIRIALGASRWQLLRQLLTESVLLSTAGGAIGLLLSHWGVRALLTIAPADIPRLETAQVDVSVLAFTFTISAITGILFGLAPAWQASRTDANESLKSGGRTATGGVKRHRARRILLVAEVALSLVLCAGAGLMIRSFLKAKYSDPGFDTNNLLTFELFLNKNYKTDPQQAAAFRRIVDRLGTLPGVSSASMAGCVPIDGTCWGSVFTIAGRPLPERAKLPNSQWNVLGAHYFETMRIPLKSGRTFKDSDTADSLPVMVINQAAARKFFPNEDALGKHIKQAWPESPGPWRQIVGVVGDVRQNGLDADQLAEIYLPHTQQTWNSMTIVIRTFVPPASMLPAARAAIQEIDKELPISAVHTMDEYLAQSLGRRNFTMMLLGIFAGMALLLAGVGIYGVIAYSLSQRIQEIGIRMALGARRADVVRLMVGEGMATAAVGILLGLAAAFLLTRLTASLLYGVGAYDPLSFGLVCVAIVTVAMVASFVPAYRATRVDPLAALRQE